MENKKPIIHHLDVKPTHFKSFKSILKTKAIDDYVEHEFKPGTDTSEILFSKLKKVNIRKLALCYWEELPWKVKSEMPNYLRNIGYQIITGSHPSLLINAMKELTEDTIKKLDLPWYTTILLLNNEEKPMYVGGSKCFFSVQRDSGGKRSFKLHGASWEAIIPSEDCALLLERI